MNDPVIVQAETKDWRCGSCAERGGPIRPAPLLAVYTITGGVHIAISGRRTGSMHYVVDLTRGSLLAHCPAGSCHQWRELYVNGHGEIAERHYAGLAPAIGCKCESGGTATDAAD